MDRCNAGLPLSTLLFNLLLADVEEEMGKVRWEGIKVEEDRVYILAYDMMLLAKNEEEMRSMIERLEEYLERKGLELKKEKTKLMRFRKRGGKMILEMEGKKEVTEF